MSRPLSDDKPILANSFLTEVRFLLPIFCLSFGGLLGLQIYFAVSEYLTNSLIRPETWFLLFWVLVFFLWCLKAWRMWRFWEQLEPRRFEAAADPRSTLAVRQFPVVLPALTLPQRIIVRMKRTYLAFWVALFLLFSAADRFAYYTERMRQGAKLGITFVWSSFDLATFTLPVFLSLVIVIFLPLIVRTTLTVRDDGIEARGGRITWQEACFFACYRIPLLMEGPKGIVQFELSSPTQMVTWWWVRDPQSPLTGWGSTLSTETYHSQMQAICDLVIARTGLPLHDLSNPQENIKLGASSPNENTQEENLDPHS